MKKIPVVAFCLFFFLGLFGCDSEKCDLATYRKNAEPLMQELGEVYDRVDVGSDTSRAKAENDLIDLLERINQVECREEFPLKHETLEYAVRHVLDALLYADAEDYTEASNSVDKSRLNIDRFFDWTVDVD